MAPRACRAAKAVSRVEDNIWFRSSKWDYKMERPARGTMAFAPSGCGDGAASVGGIVGLCMVGGHASDLTVDEIEHIENAIVGASDVGFLEAVDCSPRLGKWLVHCRHPRSMIIAVIVRIGNEPCELALAILVIGALLVAMPERHYRDRMRLSRRQRRIMPPFGGMIKGSPSLLARELDFQGLRPSLAEILEDR